MKSARNTGRHPGVVAGSTWDSSNPLRREEASPRAGTLLVVIIVAVLSGLLLIVAGSKPLLSQTVRLVTVDVNVVAQGYRISKLTGSSVTNEKNEKIGTIDDFVVARNRSLFAVLQVGGFLGLGGHLVAVPFETLVIDDEGRSVHLPGASKDELKKLPEIKYRS
jgi:hypothetical protein